MPEQYPFQKMALPYAYVSLLPYCDPDTLYVHHVKIYGTYVDMLNYQLTQYPEYQSWTLEELIYGKLQLPVTAVNQIKDSTGAVYAHTLFFNGLHQQMAAPAQGRLFAQMTADFGSIENFQKLFKQAAYYVPGSGWVWLVSENTGKLHIVTTRDNEIPQMDAFTGIFALDIWEHAYFLCYSVDVERYIDHWFQALNWEKAALRYDQLLKNIKP